MLELIAAVMILTGLYALGWLLGQLIGHVWDKMAPGRPAVGRRAGQAQRYFVHQGPKVVDYGITYDLHLQERESLLQRRYPNCHLEPCGPPVAWLEGLKWVVAKRR